MRIQLKRQATVNAPANRAWKVIAHEFDEIERWSSSINKSGAITGRDVSNDSAISGRYCDAVQETFTNYDEKGMNFSYEMVDPPWFTRSISNTWAVHSLETGKSLIEMKPEIECHPLLGLLLMPIVKPLGNLVADRTFEEVAHYIEHDQPHPRKVKAQQRNMKTTS